MKKRTLSMLLMFLAIFAIIPFATASAASSSVQVSGTGNLFYSANLYGGNPGVYGPEASFKVTNSKGQVVSNNYRACGATSPSPCYVSFTVSNLPLDTYTITGTGVTPNTSVQFNQPSFN